jgi:hypothetical protein
MKNIMKWKSEVFLECEKDAKKTENKPDFHII